MYPVRLLIWCKYYMMIKRSFKVVKRFRRDSFKYLFVTWAKNPGLL